MTLSSALGILRRRRLLVGVGLLIAIAVGLFVTYRVSLGVPPQFHSRQHTTGESTAQILIDTPVSQIATAKTPPDQISLYTRANELADLVATAPVQQAIAHQAGITLPELAITPPPTSVVDPLVGTPLALQGKKVATSGQGAWQLHVTLDPTLPIVAFDATAPTPRGAERLSTAAISAVTHLVNTTASDQRVPVGGRLVVRVVGPPAAAARLSGPTKALGMATSVVLFLAFCLAIVVFEGRRRQRALSSDAETRQADLSGQLGPTQAGNGASQHDRITALHS